MFQEFNIQYFAGSLPDYKIVVVCDVWFWETERWGYPEFSRLLARQTDLLISRATGC